MNNVVDAMCSDFDCKKLKVHQKKSKCFFPANYCPVLSFEETNEAINIIRIEFEKRLCKYLNLKKVISPIVVEASSGFQDDLSGIERPVEFDCPALEKDIQILQDNCKWRRLCLSQHHYLPGHGILSSLDTAIRRDEALVDNIHSIVVNNITWERVIETSDRNLSYLKGEILKCIFALCETQEVIKKEYPLLNTYFDENVSFVTCQELEDMYSSSLPSEREYLYVKDCNGIVCLLQIGGRLKSGVIHGFRSPDYDDWTLNFDILVYYPLIDKVIEIGGGGIRVTGEELKFQVQEVGWNKKIDTPYHKAILNNEFIPTVGGAFGGDRIAMILTNKCHIGEVRPSVWDSNTILECIEKGIPLM